jgi:anti-sigma factor RsiW
VTRDEARGLYSEYLEDALDPATRDQMQAFLASEPECASELFGLARTLALLHRLPPREPTLDLWREFAPKVEAFRAERRLSLRSRLRLHWNLLVSQVSEGVILWTYALAQRARYRLSRHLLQEAHDHEAH